VGAYKIVTETGVRMDGGEGMGAKKKLIDTKVGEKRGVWVGP